jgi:hypothetical protein
MQRQNILPPVPPPPRAPSPYTNTNFNKKKFVHVCFRCCKRTDGRTERYSEMTYKAIMSFVTFFAKASNKLRYFEKEIIDMLDFHLREIASVNDTTSTVKK